jgi:hypothetical protein
LTEFVIPPYLIDPMSIPAPLLGSEPGSFARYTMSVRVPRIAEETIEQNAFPPGIGAAMIALWEELLDGPVQPLREETPDRVFWNTISAAHLGRPWLEAPWYWAEAYFYRRVLEAIGYFRPGPWQGRDPFALTKATEWQPEVAPRAVGLLLARLPEDPLARFADLIQGSLWGNRIDLSYRHVSAQFAQEAGLAAHQAGDAANLLIDDTTQAWSWLNQLPSAGGRPGVSRIILVADNAGTEQAMDLALIDFLLAGGLATEVHLHLKPQPFFVSDAMPADLETALTALTGAEESDSMQAAAGAEAAALARRVRGYLADGRLQVRTHWAYTTCLHYFQLPADLLAEVAGSRLVIFKGDANYRRLLGDGHWPPDTSFAAATAYFPAPLIALRTLKSEVITGLAPGRAQALQAEDDKWLVNGKRGVIQAKV